VDADSRNDPHVYGFDCSGLTMYALAPYLRGLDHDAAKQYTEVGRWHPALDALEPGDLVFWSHDGTIDGIGHVAVYIGAGQVVQAPQSGDHIRVTPIYQVESGDMGATRPLT
jgi:cell wall-associated NlpC family hydrolase